MPLAVVRTLISKHMGRAYHELKNKDHAPATSIKCQYICYKSLLGQNVRSQAFRPPFGGGVFTFVSGTGVSSGVACKASCCSVSDTCFSSILLIVKTESTPKAKVHVTLPSQRASEIRGMRVDYKW